MSDSSHEPEGAWSKIGAEPTAAFSAYYDEAERRGKVEPRDSSVVARVDGVVIWHTEKVASGDVPCWRPAFLSPRKEVSALYRGFAVEQLSAVLETGLDVPARSAFFATDSAAYAWEHPFVRSIAAMLVLDRRQTERSFVEESTAQGQATTVDKSVYRSEYVDNGRLIHTRFDRESFRGTQTYAAEQCYGFWIPGDARSALLAVVLGGPRSTVVQLLKDCAPSGLDLIG